jgi:hypothetical protein
VSSLREVLIKTGEQTQKSQIKSHELIEKSNDTGREAITKEAIEKAQEKASKSKKQSESVTKEHTCKEKEGKESEKKKEIEQKLAVEKVKKEANVKEIAYKRSIKPAPAKPCNPVTALEKYVKQCRDKEEEFSKYQIKTEKTLKEVKAKNRQARIDESCRLTRTICKQIYDMSSLREDRIVKLVAEHTQELEAAMAKTEKFEAVQAEKMKFDICKSAAMDMKYFVNKLLYNNGFSSAFAPDKVVAQAAAVAPVAPVVPAEEQVVQVQLNP